MATGAQRCLYPLILGLDLFLPYFLSQALQPKEIVSNTVTVLCAKMFITVFLTPREGGNNPDGH